MGLISKIFDINNGEEEFNSFKDHDCNMVLCIVCWNERVIQHGVNICNEKGIHNKRCSTQNNCN